MSDVWFGSPGETIKFSCPDSSPAIYQNGAYIPNAEDPVLYVLKEENGNYLLAPMKAGNFKDLPLCSPENGAQTNLSFQLMMPPQSQMPSPSPPLPPMAFPFPWIWLLKVLLLMLIVFLSGLTVFSLWKKRRDAKKNQTKKQKVKLSPEEKLRLWIQSQSKTLAKIDSDLSLQQEIYFEGLRKLRKFLEHRLDFYAPGATAREFVSELRSTLLVRRQRLPSEKISADLVGRVESLVFQADAAIYARDQFDPQVVKSFVEQISKIYAELKNSEVPLR